MLLKTRSPLELKARKPIRSSWVMVTATWLTTAPARVRPTVISASIAWRVGLAWLAENSAAPKSGAKSGKRKRRDPWRDIQEYLTTQPSEALINLLLDVAQRDDRLYQSLLLKAERTSGGGNVTPAFRRAIGDAKGYSRLCRLARSRHLRWRYQRGGRSIGRTAQARHCRHAD